MSRGLHSALSKITTDLNKGFAHPQPCTRPGVVLAQVEVDVQLVVGQRGAGIITTDETGEPGIDHSELPFGIGERGSPRLNPLGPRVADQADDKIEYPVVEQCALVDGRAGDDLLERAPGRRGVADVGERGRKLRFGEDRHATSFAPAGTWSQLAWPPLAAATGRRWHPDPRAASRWMHLDDDGPRTAQRMPPGPSSRSPISRILACEHDHRVGSSVATARNCCH